MNFDLLICTSSRCIIYGSHVACTLCFSFQSEYPKYTPLLAKILEAVPSRNNDKDKISHEKEVAALCSGDPCYLRPLEDSRSCDLITFITCFALQVIDAANEVVDSVDRDELAKNFTLRSDPDDEEAEKIKKKMETTRDQLAEALYQKGLALAEIESLQVGIVNFFRSTFMVI
ncbi:hypothetical protein DVH24_024767 [Malus domestica]|uniref:Uncharacterized protein n=1 Tax=Malus domestica TaxID=3750 RepID=A0A498JMM5_MALDO|nr:hypothetical protein DVH24_024767 [Malus domestica]